MKIIAKRQNYSWSKKVPVLTVEKINLTHQNWSRKPIQIIIINYPKKNPVCSKCKNVLIKNSKYGDVL